VRRRPLSPGGVLGTGPRFLHRLEDRLRAYDLGAEALYLAWELCRCVTGLAPEEAEALGALVVATLVNHGRGSTCLPLEGDGGGPARALVDELAGPGVYDVARTLLADPRLEPVVGRPGDYRPLVVDGDRLYHQRLHAFEERLAQALRPRLAAGPGAGLAPTGAVAAALERVLARPPLVGGQPVTLSAEQQEAVRQAVQRPLTVITGGPGTGKTAIVVSILRVLARLGTPASAIALAAPTGKAANRLQEAIGRGLAALAAPEPEDLALVGTLDASTLHRLLGASRDGARFRRHERDPLPASVVIVDECSMIDLWLMDRLVRAVRPEALLVLLGDAEQLPSVAAGAVFRDLVPAAAGQGAVRLTHSYRMDAGDPAGRHLLEVARRINEGRADEVLPAAGAPAAAGQVVPRAALADLAFAGAELVPGGDAAALEAFLAAWCARRLLGLPDFSDLVRRTYGRGPAGFAPADVERLERLFAHHDSHRILCLTRGDERPTGAAAVNDRLHDLLLAATAPEDDGARRVEFLVGAPIMMLENDYERRLFNGDQGLVLWVREPGQAAAAPPMAVFRRAAGDYGVFDLGALRGRLQRAFAVTVHKGQGSEFDHVAVILPDQWVPLLTREILYTAVTRSRRSVVIVGAPDVLREGVRRRAERASGLAGRLAPAT
jgi:exodeoxyribonuclease V alpha subunit